MELDRITSLKNSDLDNLFLHLQRIPDGVLFNELFKISDIIFASYLNFADSSNILTKVSFFKKPVIVSDNTLLSKRVKKYNLGVCIKEGMVSETIIAIENILSSFNYNEAKFEEYYSLHSESKLKSVLNSIITKAGT